MQNDRVPIALSPVMKPTIWGGRRLVEEWGYAAPDGPIGECWAISAHPHGDCTIADGPYAGRVLSELWDERRDLFGNLDLECFPLLVKLIDAADDLSIQVHPDNDYARKHEAGSLGKHECWYVLEAGEDTHIIVGQHAASREEFIQLVNEDRWDVLVNRIPVRQGDCFDITPGTLHAILGGTLLLEIQQSSDVTYRVHDYGRRQADGSLRETHLDKALDVIDYDSMPPEKGKVVLPSAIGMTSLLACDDFCVDYVRVEDTTVMAQSWPFICMSVISGKGVLSCNGVWRDIEKGVHLIIPSESGELRIVGQLELICCHL